MIQLIGKLFLPALILIAMAVDYAYASDCTGLNMVATSALKCFASDMRDTDAKVTTTYQILLKKVTDIDKSKIEQNQRAWIKERDNKCLLDSSILGRERWFDEVAKSDSLMLCEMRYFRTRIAQIEKLISVIESNSSQASSQTPIDPSILDSALQYHINNMDYQVLTKNARKKGLWYFEVSINGSAISKLSNSESTAIEIMCVNQYANEGNGWLAYSGANDNHESNVIGLAIDLNKGSIYLSQNGVWLNGVPGISGGGKMLLSNNFVCGIQSIQPVDDLLKNGIINTNFGESPFVFDPPTGFKPFYARPVWFHVEDASVALSADYQSADLSGYSPTILIKNVYNEPKALPDGTKYKTAYAQYEVDCELMTLKQGWTSYYSDFNATHAVSVSRGAVALARPGELGQSSLAGGFAKTACFLKKNGLGIPQINLDGNWDVMASPNPSIRIFEAADKRQFKNGFMLIKQKNEFTADTPQYSAKEGNMSMGVTAFDCNKHSAHQLIAAKLDKQGRVINGSFYNDDDATPKLPENRERFSSACLTFLNNKGAQVQETSELLTIPPNTPKYVRDTSSTDSATSLVKAEAVVSKASRRSNGDDLRHCLELKTDADIAACAGK